MLQVRMVALRLGKGSTGFEGVGGVKAPSPPPSPWTRLLAAVRQRGGREPNLSQAVSNMVNSATVPTDHIVTSVQWDPRSASDGGQPEAC